MTEIVVTCCILFAIVLLTLLASFNGLVHLRQQVRSAWGDMDAQLKRRYELLPKLVNVVQTTGVAEAVGISAVVTAKHQAAVAFNPPQLAHAEAALSGAIHAVFVAADTQPALKSDSRFDEIRQQLIASETQIAQSRQQYNDRVLAYNAAVAGFPYSLSAMMFGFARQATFDVSQDIAG